jgi:outer membrane protein assembly factor BamB
MSALGRKVLDLAEQQGLLDGKAIAELRRQVAESKFVVTPEAIAKVLVDHGHLTPFQARKLVSQAQGDQPDPVEQRAVEKARAKRDREPVEELTLADETGETAPPPAPANAQDIIDLELFEVPNERATPRPVKAKRPASQSPPARQGAKESEPPALDKPVEGSTADDFVELEAIDTAPQARGNRWKTDPPSTALNETIDMPPLDPSGPPDPLVSTSIDDLFEPDPIPKPAPRKAANRPSAADTVAMDWPAPATPEAGPLARPLPPPRRAAKNVWDSPLLLVGGGALGLILVAFLLLLYALTRGSAAEMFNKAEEEYRSGSYATATALYEKFLKQYPGDANASLARVRRSMATLRQVTDDGKNPRLGLETATQVLPHIETEEKFSEARSELATILPDIADGFATQAAQTHDSSRKADLVKSAGEALSLVNNPAYLPASLRKDRESQIGRIIDKLKAAERSIQQDKDLAAAVEKITAATEKGNAKSAYQLQAELLRTYPGLATNAQLVAAIRQVGEKERQLVTTSEGGDPPLTTDTPAGSDRVVIAFAQEPRSPVAAGRPVFLLIEGAVYGIDTANGRVLWRRFVGYETTNQPISLSADGRSDAVFFDGRRHELVRVNGLTGELVWRQTLGAEAAGPVGADGRVFVTTQKGRVIAMESGTGKIMASAQLPQGATIAPAVRQSRVYQLGEHSTLFVLDANSLLACVETVYLGHLAGEVLVPPVAVLDQVLIFTSPTDEYSEIQVLSPDAKTKRLAPFGKPQRLKGRVVTAVSVSGAQVAAITDWGQVVVDEIDPAGAQEHWRLVAGLDASETAPRAGYCALDRNRLWVAGHRRTLFEVQSALSQLRRSWTENHDDSFLAPLRLEGEVLVQIRRRSGVGAVLVEGSRAVGGEIGETLWTTHIASPLVALAARPGDQAAVGLTAEGRLYRLGNEQFTARMTEKPEFSPGKSGTAIFDDASISADGQLLVWTESRVWGQVYVQDLKSGAKPTSISLPAEAAAPAVSLAGGVVAPLANGTVVWLARDAAAKVAPFMPQLVPDALPLWTKPAVLGDDKTFLISDGRSAVYAVTRKEAPQPQLARVGESQSSGPVSSPLVRAGSIVFGVIRQERSDALAGFDARGAAAFEPIALEGRVEAGPYAVGGLAIAAAEPDGLVCVAGDGTIRWKLPAERGPLAGPPLALADGDLLVAYQSGLVCLLDAASGKELAQHDVGEPLAGPVCVVGPHALLAGSDGVVHRISIPPRP